MKKLNSRLAVFVLLFLICISSFTAVAALGIVSLTKCASAGVDPFDVLSASNYEESGEQANQFSSLLQKVHWTSFEDGEGDYDIDRLAQHGIHFYVADGNEIYTNMNEQGKAAHYDAEHPAPAGLVNEDGGALSALELRELGKSEGAYRLYNEAREFKDQRLFDYSEEWEHIYYSMIVDYDENDALVNGGTLPITAYLALSDEYIEMSASIFKTLKYEVTVAVAVMLVLTLIWLGTFIALCVLCGRRTPDGTVVLKGMSRWYTELILCGGGLAAFCGGAICVSVLDSLMYEIYGARGYFYYHGYEAALYRGLPDLNNLQMAVFIAVLWVCAAACLYLFLILVRKWKAGRLFSGFAAVRLCKWLWGGVKDIYYGGGVMRKVIVLLAAMCLCSASIIGFPVVFIVSLIFGSKLVKQYEEIKRGVAEVRNGNLSYKIPIEGEPKGEFQMLAADINAISEGFDVAVKQELKNQRMKTDLISNVSHDIKTPLTSIITYVDLLKREGLDCEDAPKYLDVLDQKSVRLKKLTEDLFEAAKASSGDIPVTMGRVDLVSLLNQTLGELGDRLSERGLEVIVKPENERFYVNADGQLLWRVLENIFGNAIKYAMERSRVYVDIAETEAGSRRMIKMEVKNISQNPLNIPEEELMERFKRGDESRSTEGSGLGLSIAKDLMAIQRGQFSIVIDGDLFKAVLLLEYAN